MTAALLYSAIALAVLLLAVVLLRPWAEPARGEAEIDLEEDAQGLLAESSVRLVERVFDPRDYRWLRDEIGLPDLARSLAQARRQLALKWLRALRRSFAESLRTPQPPEASLDEVPGSWRLLWLTLRFHFLLSYALWVVRFFGPYHRLIPSLDWAEGFLTLTPAEEEPPARLPHRP